MTGNSIGNIINDGIAAQKGEWIYYQNPDDGEKIYKIRTDGSSNQKLNNDLSWSINLAGDWIYYRNTFDVWKTYKIRTDGSGKQRVD